MNTCGARESHLALTFALASLTALSCELPLELEGQPPPGPAATCVDYGEQLRIVGSIPVSVIRDIAVAGGVAFVAGGQLSIVETRPTGSPVLTEQLGGGAYHLATTPGALLVAQSSRLSILDVTPARRGKELGSLSCPFWIQDLQSAGNHAYLLDDRFGLWIADIGNPAAPRFTGSVGVPERSFALAVRGGLACVTTDSGLCVIDVSNPASPQRIGWLTSENRMDAVAMVDHYAVVSEGLEITVVDLADPSAPDVVLRSDLPGMHAQGMAFDGTRAYLCGDDLVVIDLTRPTAPTLVGRIPRVDARAIALDGEDIYLGGNRGLIVARGPRGRRPAPLMWVNMQGTGVRTALRDPLACVAGGGAGLWVVDLTGTPGVSGRLDLLGGAADVVLDSSYAYVAAGRGGFVVAEVQFALPPRIASRLDLPGESLAIVREGHLAYLAQRDFGLWIADVSDPLAPRVLGSVDTPGEANDLVVRDGRAWITDFRFGLLAAEVSDPARPRIVARLAVERATALALAGHLAYVATESGLQVIDVSAPDTPRLIGGLPIPERMFDVAIDGELAYLATGVGLLVADVSDPESPVLIGIADEARARSVLIDPDSDRIFVTNGNLTVIRPQCPVPARRELP